MAHVRELLKDKNFSLLWFSQIVSNFGDRLNQMALIGLIYARTPGSTIELAKILSFTILPVFLIGPIAGIYVDRWNRKRTMITCDFIRAGLVVLIPIVCIYSKTIVPIYIMVFIIFSATRFFLPAKLSIIPDIVDKEKLLLANSLNSTTMMIATIIGYGFGGVIVERLGARGGFFLDSTTYLVSGIMLSFVVLRFKKKVEPSGPREKIRLIIKRTILGDIKEGFIYLKDHKDIRMVASTMFLIMAGVGSIYVIIIVFVQELLHSSTKHLGFLAMFLGAGLFIGSLLYGKFGGKLDKRKVINSGLFITGVLITIFSISLKFYPNFFIAAFFSSLLGMFASPIVVSSNTILHEVMADKMRGRTFSSIEIIMHIGFLVFMMITSFAAERISKASILITIGLIFSLIGILKLISGILEEKRKIIS
ncbi:MAG: MFS transporter [Candidatus Omnitrophota bacterium]